jgi:uncharacterized membrane protein
MADMDFYVILLCVVHIFAGVFWVGGLVLFFAFLEPTAKATAPSSQKLMQYLMTRQRFSSYTALISLLTVLAGALLYWRDSGGLQPAWIGTRTGIGFTLGAVFGISAFLVGFFGVRPATNRLAALGTQIEAAGVSPSTAQEAELTRINKVVSRLHVGLLPAPGGAAGYGDGAVLVRHALGDAKGGERK